MAGNGVELVWEGKRREVERVALPFQRVEVINESRATRQAGPLFAAGAGPGLPPDPLFDARGDVEQPWRNKLIWGDNKYVLASLLEGDPSIGLESLAGKVDLIYIDPPFATGADFSVSTTVGDVDVDKAASAIEEVAYRDTWGMGTSSYFQMIYERLVLARATLSPNGSVYVHRDSRLNSGLRLLMDEVFSPDLFQSDIVWRRQSAHSDSNRYGAVHDTILFYSNSPKWTWNEMLLEPSPDYIDEDEFQREFPIEPSGYLSVLVRLIERETRLTGQFARLAPLLKGCIETRLFGQSVSMEDEIVMRVLNRPDVKKELFEAFVIAINELSIEEQVVSLDTQWIRASNTNAFTTTRQCVDGRKTVFNLVPCDSQLEADFASFLESEEAVDVLAYFKNETAVHFDMEYQGHAGGLRKYRPDFVVRVGDGVTYIVETKGQEDLEVERKDLRARRWCEDASGLTGTKWAYMKVPEAIFRSYPVRTFAQLVQLISG